MLGLDKITGGWRKRRRSAGVALALTVALAAGGTAAATPASAGLLSSTNVIVQGGTVQLVTSAVSSLGGRVLTELPIVDGVLARVPSLLVGVLDALPGITISPNLPVHLDMTADGARAPTAIYPAVTGADALATAGNTGSGVTVAVLDTGITPLPDFAGRLLGGVDLTGGNNPWSDSYGHGTFVAGLIAGNGASSSGQYAGEAPGANLASIKVAGASGLTDAATVISGIGWAADHASSLGIRVLNLSLGEVPYGPTIFNPLNQAVEAAWQAGVTVVTSAGNSGPAAGTITSPGDDPFVITAGSFDDNGTLAHDDDTISAFSSVGPTASDGWLKPDVVAPGRSVVSLRAPGSAIDNAHPDARIGAANFVGSGTSFSAAVTSGAAALVIAAHPQATPDDVKARLSATAHQGPSGNPLAEGHGVLDAAAAAASAPITLHQDPGLLPVLSLGQSLLLSLTWSVSGWDAGNYTPAGTDGQWWDSQNWNSQNWNSQNWNSQNWNSQNWNSQNWNSQNWNSQNWNSQDWG